MDRYVLGFIVSWCLRFSFASAAISVCRSTANVTSFEVSGCPIDQTVCHLKKGSNATIKITFIPNEDIESLKTVVHGIIGGMPMPFPMPQSDICASQLACPLQKGETYDYVESLPVKSSYPPVKVTVKWELQYNDMDAVCLMIPSKIEKQTEETNAVPEN